MFLQRVRFREALVVVQNAVRHHVVVRNWPWFRLMQLVAPMVPKEREKVMIADLTVERDKLKEVSFFDPAALL